MQLSWSNRQKKLPHHLEYLTVTLLHVCRHSDGAAAVSGDMFGEQTCIKQGKGVGGMKRISTNPDQVAMWIQSFGICSHLSKSLDEMYDDAEALDKTMKPNRHKEEGKGRWELDGPG